MQTPSAPLASARPFGWSLIATALTAAAMGAVGGSVAACELSGTLIAGLSNCAATGAGLGAATGALLGMVAAPLSRYGSRPRQAVAHRPSGTTRCAAGLVVAAPIAAILVWIGEWTAAEGMEQLASISIGFV